MYSDKLTNQFWLKPLAREFYLTRKLPKCISFLRMGGKVIKAVISKVFGVVYYEPEVRISKFKMTNLIWRSHTQNSINFVFFLLQLVWKLLLGDFWNHWRRLQIQILRWRIQYGGHVYVFPWKLEDSDVINLKTITRVFKDPGKFCNRPLTEILT